MFHTIKEVKPLENYELLITFCDNTRKTYRLEPLFQEYDIFNNLKTYAALYSQVKVDTGGYGISWNEELDLSCDELWEHGTALPA